MCLGQLPTPNELAEWMAPALTSDDQAVLQSSEVLWTLLQPALSRATGSGHATASGASSGFSQVRSERAELEESEES